MDLDGIISVTLAFIRDHEHWTLLLVFILAFGESLAFLSLLLPATVILLAAGSLIPELSLSFTPIWLAAAAGAWLGDWISWLVGHHYQDRVRQMWPLRNHPAMLARGERFFARWGTLGVFFGRFLGPLRATVPLVAGMCRMRALPFQLANILSAMVWAFGMLAPGAFGLPWLTRLVGG
ncbi:DedA family protein [Pantoea sp. 1.19]|uniref:DedA family protein n=1 Tax=Pantoea sp. 1.19 TaxID=1925589 RepID=UPI0009488B2D|nr:DedA family protein [Pantoea sp. 1.19]